MKPDFSKKTVDTLARRAAYICSNPDCRAQTVGPNDDSQKSTTIGEAAHILGARPRSKRFVPEMTDTARAEITNGIWLCRNCHKFIDSNDARYTRETLFRWREDHERFVSANLGSKTDRIQQEELTEKLAKYGEFPPIVRRIVIDRPPGWEFRLTSEVMRHLNEPAFRRLGDLRDGLCVGTQIHIQGEAVVSWLQSRMTEYTRIVEPFVALMDRLTASWGELGVPGDEDEIVHICILIRDAMERVVEFEEQTAFSNVPEEYEKAAKMFHGILGSQAEKLAEIPIVLNEMVAQIDAYESLTGPKPPKETRKTIHFELPDGWDKQVVRELKRAEAKRTGTGGTNIWAKIGLVLLFGWLVSTLI